MSGFLSVTTPSYYIHTAVDPLRAAFVEAYSQEI